MKVISKQVRQVFFHLAHATCRKSQKMHWNTLFLPRFLNQNVHVCRTCAPTCILYLATCPEVEEEVCVWFARRAGQCACAWKRINLMVRLADYVAAGVSSFGSHATFSVNPARSNHKWQGHVFLNLSCDFTGKVCSWRRMKCRTPLCSWSGKFIHTPGTLQLCLASG